MARNSTAPRQRQVMRQAHVPMLIALSALFMPGCDKLEDFGPLDEAEFNACDDCPAEQYAHGMALTIEAYLELQEEYYSVEGFSWSSTVATMETGTRVVVLSTDTPVTCDTLPFGEGPNRTMRVYLPPLEQPGTYASEISISETTNFGGGSSGSGTDVHVSMTNETTLAGWLTLGEYEQEHFPTESDLSTSFDVTMCP